MVAGDMPDATRRDRGIPASSIDRRRLLPLAIPAPCGCEVPKDACWHRGDETHARLQIHTAREQARLRRALREGSP